MAYSKPKSSSRRISLIDTGSLVMSIPKVIERLACGSRSMTKTRAVLSNTIRPAAKLTAVVVFPVPPFMLATATIRGMIIPAAHPQCGQKLICDLREYPRFVQGNHRELDARFQPD